MGKVHGEKRLQKMNENKKICIEIDSELWKAIKMQAFEKGISLKDAVTEAIERWLKERGKI